MIPDTERRSPTYTGTGAVSGYAFTFKVFADTDMQVIVADDDGVESTFVLGSDYTVALNGDQETYPGGTINLTVPLPLNYTLVVLGAVAYSQTSQLPTGGSYNATVVERALDRIVILCQQVLELASRGLRLSPLADGVDVELPAPVPLSVLGWNADGGALQNYTPATLGVDISYAQWQTESFSGDGVATAFVLAADAGVASNIDLRVDNVPQTPDVSFSYTASSRTITFLVTPPAGGADVVARYGQALAPIPFAPSYAEGVNANGHGSTNTCIRRFSTINRSAGTDVTLSTSLTAGWSFTVNTSGMYAITYTDASATAGAFFGVSVIPAGNDAALSTSVASIVGPFRVALARADTSNTPVTVSSTLYLSAGAIVRAHTSGGSAPTDIQVPRFCIVRVA